VELRDKLKDWYQEESDSAQSDGKQAYNEACREAEEALIALGYKPQEAGRAISRAATKLEEAQQQAETSVLVRIALKDMTG